MTTLIQLDPGASLPTFAHPDDIGADIKALHTYIVQGDGTEHKLETISDCFALRDKRIDVAKVKIDTGVHATPPQGYYLELVPNSRLAKTPFMFANSIGIIDPGYTGSMKVILNCVNSITPDDIVPFLPGRVVGQLILRKIEHTAFTQVATLADTARGDGGFGSTEEKKQVTPCDTCVHALDCTMLHWSRVCEECENYNKYKKIS